MLYFQRLGHCGFMRSKEMRLCLTFHIFQSLNVQTADAILRLHREMWECFREALGSYYVNDFTFHGRCLIC